jgi:hypothetical protein
MSQSTCPHERQVLEAAARARWDAALTAHVRQCEDCSDLALVSGFLHAAEAPRELDVDLDQASRIWRVADAERRREQAARALLPVAVGEFAACLFGGVALLGFAARYAGSFADLSDAAGARLLADPMVASLGSVAAVLLIGVSVVSLALAVGFRVARS